MFTVNEQSSLTHRCTCTSRMRPSSRPYQATVSDFNGVIVGHFDRPRLVCPCLGDNRPRVDIRDQFMQTVGAVVSPCIMMPCSKMSTSVLNANNEEVIVC